MKQAGSKKKLVITCTAALLICVAAAVGIAVYFATRPKAYAVTFEPNGGTAIEMQTVRAGETLLLPTPTRNGGGVRLRRVV